MDQLWDGTYVCKGNDEASNYISEEVAKINNYNKNEDIVSKHKRCSYELLTVEQVKGLMINELGTMPIGMLFKLMSYN